jgi:uncharacterized protein
MRRRALNALLGLLAACAWPGADAAGLDCNARPRSAAADVICSAPQLARAEEEINRRLDNLSRRRMRLGQYLGLRHWHANWQTVRASCGADQACLAASYRAQLRFLDRLQQCLETAARPRTCLRTTLEGERAAAERR